MSDKNKHRKKSLEDFLKYSSKNMSEAEKNAFERDLQKNAFDSDAMDGLSQFDPALISEDIPDLNARLDQRISKANKRFTYWHIAASIAVLMIISVSFYYFFLNDLLTVPPDTSISKIYESIESEDSSMEMAEDITEKELAASPEKSIIREKELIKPQPLVDETNQFHLEDHDKLAISPPAEKIIGEQRFAESSSITLPEEDSMIPHGISPSGSPIYFDTENEKAEIISHAYSQDQSKKASKSPSRNLARPMDYSPDAKTYKVIGKVSSSDDHTPIAGATIIVKGSTVGTVTNMNGYFEMDVPDDDTITLVASSIGMESSDIEIKDKNELDIVLEPAIMALEEIVVVGYGVSTVTGQTETSDYQKPYPVIGWKEFEKYCEENRIIPESVKEKRSVVTLTFKIGADGRPVNIVAERSPNDELSKEAERLLQDGPDWKPAIKNGIILEEEVSLKIVFRKML
jgi:hypothetical protein